MKYINSDRIAVLVLLGLLAFAWIRAENLQEYNNLLRKNYQRKLSSVFDVLAQEQKARQETETRLTVAEKRLAAREAKATLSEAQAVKAAKSRILMALKAGDWQRFRQFCCPHITIEEYWRVLGAYLTEMGKDASEGTLFSHGDGADATRDAAFVNAIRIAVNEPLSTDAEAGFRRFSENVHTTLTHGPPGWVSVAQEDVGTIYSPLAGTAISGKVASNVHWWIQLEKYQGDWKVRRLVLEGR